MAGKKQQIAKPKKADAENAKVQLQDFHLPGLKSPRDVASGQAT